MSGQHMPDARPSVEEGSGPVTTRLGKELEKSPGSLEREAGAART